MLKLKNYWKNNSCAVKKFGIWLKATIAGLTTSAYVQGNIKLAMYVLIAGGLVDLLLQFLPPDEPGKPNQGNGIITAIALVMVLFTFTSCRIIKPEVDTTKTDSTYTTFKQIDIKVAGAKVHKGLDLDSLFRASLMQRDQRRADSIANLKAELQFKKDSIAALKAGKPIPPAPVLIPPKPNVQYVTDPQTKAQLSYWIDEYGKLQLGCESKDQVVSTLQAQVNKLTKQVTTQKLIVPETPKWNYIAMAVLATLLIISVMLNFFNRKS